mgnify:CR=1 FL=1
MNEYKNRVLSLEELAISAGTLVWIEDNNGDDEPCVCARKVTRWEHGSHRMYFDGSRTWYADYTYGETWRCWLKRYAGHDYVVVINEDGICDGHVTLMQVYPKHTAIRFWWKEPTQEERELEWGDGNE